MIQEQDIILRALEPEDIDFLYEIENDMALWEVSNTITPFSRYILRNYIENAHLSIYEVKQLRLLIEIKATPIGFIDLFDFDAQHKRVGVGIVLIDTYRGRGHALQALQMICTYAFSQLQMHQVHASVTEDNTKSIELFTKAGFIQTGIRKDWIYTQGSFKSEIQLQLMHP